jgi:hypothetical protein
MAEWKLEPEQVPDVLGADYLPGLIAGRLITRLRLFYRATLRPRQEQYLIGWDQWVDLARRLGVTAAVNERGFARIAWRDLAAWQAHQDAVRLLKEREETLS